MRQVWHFILGADGLVRPLETLRHIPILARHGARLSRQLEVFRAHFRGGKRRARPLVPFDLQQVARHLGGPEAACGNRHAGRHLIHALHARHLARFARVKALHLAAEYRAARNQHRQHAGQINVEAESCAAVDLFRCVEAFHWLAEQLEILGLLERNVVRQRQICSGIG